MRRRNNSLRRRKGFGTKNRRSNARMARVRGFKRRRK